MFSLLSIFSGPYALLARWLVLALACAALYATGYVRGHHSAELDFERYRGAVEALGREAEARTAVRIAADKLNKEAADVNHSNNLARFIADITRVRKQPVSRPNIVPAAAANTRSPETITLDRAILEREIRASLDAFEGESRAIIDEGSKAVIALDSVKVWALKMSQELR